MEPVTVVAKSTNRLSQDFHGYELLLLRKFQNDHALYKEWSKKIRSRIADKDYDLGEIPHSLWFLTMTLDRIRDRFLQFIQKQADDEEASAYCRIAIIDSLLTRYLNSHTFTELHLDGIFKYGDDNTLPLELFHCKSVRSLSLKYNYLDQIPADIGRLSQLECLALTNNKLQNKSLPFSLTFCRRLRCLMLDNNLLDALPGYLLRMQSLQTVHRHGNHNYFKSTFMWYHTDVNERILPVGRAPAAIGVVALPDTLQFCAARAVIAAKIDFFADDVASPIRDYIAGIYTLFNICGNCNVAKRSSDAGYKVITFKNPYLGNTCVPFQHWACSMRCAMGIEIPARHEQIAAAQQLEREYDTYVHECQRQYRVSQVSSAIMAGDLLHRRGRHRRKRLPGATPAAPTSLRQRLLCVGTAPSSCNCVVS